MHTVIIAEAGVNHNGSLEMAKKLIDVAAEAGVDYVKFQTFKTSKLVSKKAAKADYQVDNKHNKCNSQYSMLKKLELTREMHYELIAYCRQKSVLFLSTAFDPESIELLDELNIDFFKIPSGEITNKPYLLRIAQKRRPIVLSTGMANIKEVKDAVDVMIAGGLKKSQISILHCNTEYPTPYENVNLKAMLHIKEELNISVGYSDHTNGIEIPVAAVALGATIIEKHFTLDRSLPGPDHKASLEPSELKAMVSAIRNVEMAVAGSGLKEPSAGELQNINVARKSIHLSKAHKKGTILNSDSLIMKRPGDGISPMEYEKVVGKKVNTDLPYDHKLIWEDLS